MNIKLENICALKDTITTMKKQHGEWEKIFANHLSDKRAYMQNSYKSIIGRQQPNKNSQTRKTNSLSKIHTWLISIGKNPQH